MQIVIDIPEEIYSYVNTQWRDIPKDDSPISIICNAIIDGTLLPKGHGDLKDMDVLRQKLIIWDNKVNGIPNYVWKCIKDAPTIIEADKEEQYE